MKRIRIRVGQDSGGSVVTTVGALALSLLTPLGLQLFLGFLLFLRLGSAGTHLVSGVPTRRAWRSVWTRTFGQKVIRSDGFH